MNTENDQLGNDAGIDLTASNVEAGTPAYIAPEVVLGQGVDSRSDLYALGCVAYWLLTARKVFEEPTFTATLVAHKSPSAPSSCSESPVPEALDEIILSCLQKNADERPQSASELSDKLGEVPFTAPWSPDRAEDWWETHHP